jgi:hypothetical protein
MTRAQKVPWPLMLGTALVVLAASGAAAQQAASPEARLKALGIELPPS